MPCSAVTAEYRHDNTTMPVPLPSRSSLENDYSRPSRYSYNTRSSTAASDIAKYSIPRSLVTSSRSISLTEDSHRDRSQIRETLSYARKTPGSSWPRTSSTLSSYESPSSKSFSSSFHKSKNYTSHDLNELRLIYSPDKYIPGSQTEFVCSKQLSSKSVDTSSVHIRTSSTASLYSKEKRNENSISNLEVNSSVSSVADLPLVNGSKVVDTGEDAGAKNEEGVTEPLNSSYKSNKHKEHKNETMTVQASVPSRIKSSISLKKEHLANENYGLSGLRNIGNTCFLNSVVQCLSNTRILKEFLLSKDLSIEIRNSDTNGALIKAFADVVCDLWSGEGKIVNTISFKAQIQRYAPRFMGYNQQDAQEFLRYLLEGLHDDINRVATKPKNLPEIDDNLVINREDNVASVTWTPVTLHENENLFKIHPVDSGICVFQSANIHTLGLPWDAVKSTECWKQYLRCDNSRIVDLFVGQLKSTLQCTVCDHKSTTFEVFWDLSLPLLTRTSSNIKLSQCLDHFTKEEVLDGDEMPTCSKCKTRRKCTKRFSIQRFPKILVLHLKRFSPSERYRKLSATVEFPLTRLDMSAYSSSPQTCQYNLYAVSNHSGSAHSGHYTAYCLHANTQQWYEFNDSRVAQISPKNVVSNEAYILFYEQISSSRLTS